MSTPKAKGPLSKMRASSSGVNQAFKSPLRKQPLQKYGNNFQVCNKDNKAGCNAATVSVCENQLSSENNPFSDNEVENITKETSTGYEVKDEICGAKSVLEKGDSQIQARKCGTLTNMNTNMPAYHIDNVKSSCSNDVPCNVEAEQNKQILGNTRAILVSENANRSSKVLRMHNLGNVCCSPSIKSLKRSETFRSPVKQNGGSQHIPDLMQQEVAVDAEIASLQSQGHSISDLNVYIDAFHKYNETKDAAQLILGRLAELEGVTVRELHGRYNLPKED